MKMKNLKVVFMGTPKFATSVLEMLIEKTNVILVVSQMDKEVGRKKELTICPVKKLAIDNHIPVFQPLKIKEDYEIIQKMQPDLIVTCAYGQILPKELLDIPKYGSINIHASLLPKYRGASPIQYALLNGEKQTGVTLMYMDEGMDTGDIIAKETYMIKDTDNLKTLEDELSLLGAKLLEKNLENIQQGKVIRTKQDNNLASYTKMITREDEIIDYSERGEKIINKIRAFNPSPLAYLKTKDYEFKVIAAHFLEKDNPNVGDIIRTKDSLGLMVQDGIIYFDIIKPIGKKEMPIKNYLNGLR